jgi:hypothetical protein
MTFPKIIIDFNRSIPKETARGGRDDSEDEDEEIELEDLSGRAMLPGEGPVKYKAPGGGFKALASKNVEYV